jgi:predicted RNA-binding Zn ribbon-like protein
MVVMTKAPSGTEYEHELTGGRPCLDFVNTVSGDREGAPRERIEDYAALVAWARQSGTVDPAHARRLLAEARRRPADAAEVHRDALLLREALFRIFLAVAEGAEPPEDDVARLSGHLAAAAGHRRLERRDGAWALVWADPGDGLDAPLWSVAASASELLTSEADLRRVRVCGLHETRECSWLFMDQTRAGTRRWCSMKDCGNKAKARRHYERTRG